MMRLPNTFRQFMSAVSADYGQVRRYRSKYQGEAIPADSLPSDLARKIGLQMMAVVRVMKALEDSHVPVVPQVVSRLIRHLYGAEIHWRAEFEPGVTIVHGCGLVISHAAKVGTGCILFHNVTLGESVDPKTRAQGAPALGRDVHVGPGATLLGPIVIGDRSKIMAGAVVTQSIPPDSLVRPAEISIHQRHKSASGASASPSNLGGTDTFE